MSLTLLLKTAAPLFAFLIAGLVWMVGGPMAAGLALVTFLLGVVTSELDHMRWRSVEEPAQPAPDGALAVLLEVGRAPRPAAAGPPKRNFRATRPEIAIGSGQVRTGLIQRSRRESAPPPAPGEALPVVVAPAGAPEPRSFQASDEAQLVGG